MKWFAVPILFLLVLTQTFGKWVVVWEYTLNKDYIARNLCENRSRPKLLCNGKCQLAKKLAEEEKQNASGPEQQAKVKFTEVLFSNDLNLPCLSIPAKDNSKKFAPYIIRKSFPPTACVFHPPANWVYSL